MGVFLSRSSMVLFKIHRVYILTILQGANFVLWILFAKYQFASIWAQFPLMFYVGLLGGASYVNVFHLVLQDESIGERYRDLVMNLTSFFCNTGILLASVFDIMMDHTFLA